MARATRAAARLQAPRPLHRCLPAPTHLRLRVHPPAQRPWAMRARRPACPLCPSSAQPQAAAATPRRARTAPFPPAAATWQMWLRLWTCSCRRSRHSRSICPCLACRPWRRWAQAVASRHVTRRPAARPVVPARLCVPRPPPRSLLPMALGLLPVRLLLVVLLVCLTPAAAQPTARSRRPRTRRLSASRPQMR